MNTTVTLNLDIPDHLKGHELLLGRPDSSQGDWKWNGGYGEWSQAPDMNQGFQTLILRPRPTPAPRRWCPYCPSAMEPLLVFACETCWGEANRAGHEFGILEAVQPRRQHPPLLPKPWVPTREYPAGSCWRAMHGTLYQIAELRAAVEAMQNRLAGLESKP